MEIVIITGMSGAGKTSAINICQDNDYYTIDNLPPNLLYDYIEYIKKENITTDKFAFVVDIRVGRQLAYLNDVIENMSDDGINVKVLFLDASDDELVKRFQEKRRPHTYKDIPLERAISKERKELKEIKEISDYYINTTNMKLAELSNSILDVLEVSKEINIQVISFGFKHGILKEADYLFDVRFIENPYYNKSLKNLTGLDREVKEFVEKHNEIFEFVDKVENLIDFLTPYFKKQGKHNIVIGIGCTGGKHRSVVISELLNERFSKKYKSTIFHRDSKLW